MKNCKNLFLLRLLTLLLLFVTCASGDSGKGDKLNQLMQSFKKMYENASVYLREITGMRVFAVQLVCLSLLLIFVFIFNFKSFLNNKTNKNVTIKEIVVEKK
ncbi:hypothetical protein ACKWTF_011667 [Chironomus riparius]